MIYRVNSVNELYEFLPKTTEQLKEYRESCINNINNQLKKILEIPDKERTFDNTVKAFDNVNYFYHPISAVFDLVEYLYPDKQMREIAHEQSVELTNFLVDNVTTNTDIYKAFKYYVQNNAKDENLNKVQSYLIEKAMQAFKRSGLDLSEDELNKVRQLSKEISEIGLEFEANISKHKCEVPVNHEDLKGLDESFIKNLKKNKDGQYILGCDYPTYFNVLENCTVEATRKKLFMEFQNRAYPINMQLLDKLIAKRAELAKLLGYPNYTAFVLDDQMAKDTHTVTEFLNNLIQKGSKKSKKEIDLWKQELSGSIKTGDKIAPWDLPFIKNDYKKNNLKIDERKVSEYFPMENTIKQLLSIYEQFLSLKFKEVQVPDDMLWANDIKLIEAYDKNSNVLLGYLLLDLYPRPNKFTHAAHLSLIPSIKRNGKILPSVSVVMANFPKPTEDRPSLLTFKDVSTFFHEFGHAMHALLGSSEFYSFSGTHVKRDFVEMPSQMLEDWLKDKEIVKMISQHYMTKESLPNDIIDKITDLERFDSGDYVLKQIYYAMLSLAYFQGNVTDTQAIAEELYERIIPHVQWIPENHFQVSFGHLIGYGPSYYGYLWSKVFAKDLFGEIKKHGLLNPEIGRKYINQVIGRGGEEDPNNLIRAFLNRNPNEKAFLSDFGFN